jgi:FtsZ-interacting cell division protein YlmF
MADGLLHRIKTWISLEETPDTPRPGLKIQRGDNPSPLSKSHFRREKTIVDHTLRTFEDVQDAADFLKMGVPVIVTLEGNAPAPERRRMITFLSGVCYAIDGYARRIRPDVYIFTPSDVPVQSTEGEEPKEGAFEIVDLSEGGSEW